MKLITFSTCIHFLGLVEENETGFMSAGMSRGAKIVCLGDTDIILGRKMVMLHWEAVKKGWRCTNEKYTEGKKKKKSMTDNGRNKEEKKPSEF